MLEKWQRLSLYVGLYFVQGSVLAFLGNFQKPFLLSRGVALQDIALLTSLLIVPFILKIFFGLISDRISFFGFGYRKPYILLGLVLGAAGFFFAGTVDPGAYFLTFGSLVFAASLGLALFDTAIDGFAVDVTAPDDQSIVQSMMVGGKALGYICMSLLFGKAAAFWGYPTIYMLLAVLMGLAALFLLRLREPIRTIARVPVEPAARDKTESALALPQIAFFVYAVAYSFVSFGVDGLAPFFLTQNMGVSQENIGAYGSTRGIGALLGAGLAAMLARIFGLRWSAILALGLLGVGILLWVQAPAINNFYALALFWGIAWATQEAIFVALAMGLARGLYAATAFAIFMMASNIGTSLGEYAATIWSSQSPLAEVYARLALGLFLVLPILLIYFWLVQRSCPKQMENC